MNADSILLYIFGVVSALYVAHIGFYLTGANLYDIWQARRRRRLRQKIEEGGKPLEPLVSVLVPAHNEELVITRCLDSIRKSSYKKIEVFVVDDASTDDTYKLVRNYARQHRDEMKLKVIRQRTNVGKGEALNSALRDYARGELAMTIDADSILQHKTIANAVSYFDDPSVAGVAANVQILGDYTVLGVLQKIEHMIGYRSKKVYSLMNCEFVIGGVASTYRMDILRKVNFYDTDTMTEDIGLSLKVISGGNRAHRVVYGVDVVAMTEGVHSFRALLRQRFRWKYGCLQNIVKYRHLIGTNDMRFSASLALYRMPMAIISEIVLLLSPLIWLFVIHLTLSFRNPQLVVGAYTIITLYTLVTIWADENLRVPSRLHLSIYAPIAYFVFYVMDVVQFIAMVRCVFRLKPLLSKQATSGAWVSPPRIGQTITETSYETENT